MTDAGVKRCTRCLETKSLDDFNRRNETVADGRQPKCRACDSVARKAWYAANREKSRIDHRAWVNANPEANRAHKRRDHLKSKYGLSEADYLALHESQDGRCALCGTPGGLWPEPGFLKVDHCHSSGSVRGLLCSGCNVGIGLLGDTAEALDRALTYLRGTES